MLASEGLYSPHLAFLLQVLLQVQVSPLRALDALFVCACTPIAMDDSYKGPVEIYLLTAPDGKHYVGQTQCKVRNGKGGWRNNGLHARLLQHKQQAAKPEQAGRCTFLARSIRKHGPDAFRSEVLVRVSKCLANAYEKRFIEAYDCMAPNGLNLTSGGDVYTFSVESRQRMSQAKRARGSYSEDYKAILSSSARKRAKQSDLPTFIIQLAARGTNSPGYRVQIYHNGKVYRTENTAKGKAMEEKLSHAVQARDMIMKDLGMAPIAGTTPVPLNIPPSYPDTLIYLYRASKNRRSRRRWSRRSGNS